ncbi:MAG: iron ABC transporter permease [Burkholderiales bacterium]|nr:iron ABC transporter permease [Burkholderiales bacterium]
MSAHALPERKAPSGAFAFFRKRGRLSAWRLFTFTLCVLVAIPLLVVASSLLHPDRETWRHLADNVLPELIRHTLLLTLGVSVAAGILGTGLAWLTAVCDFPGRRFFSWSLMLPLALPAYVTGFVLVGLLDFTGPIATLLRQWFGPQVRLPPIRSGGGAALALTLALYPYVYLLARHAFLSQGKRALEVGQSLGLSRRQGFLRIALPLARPWIAGGVALVAMETLADFGTVAVFNYDTFTTGIYKAWYSLFSLPAAAQLASLLILFVFVVLFLEQRLRAGMRYTPTGRSAGRERLVLTGFGRLAAPLFCGAVLTVAFIVPVGQLLWWALGVAAQDLDLRYWAYLGRSLLLAGMAATLITATALLLAYARRQQRGALTDAMVRFATLGYAVPGAVLAIGIYLPIAWFDRLYIGLMGELFGREAGPLLAGTLLAMLSAYLVRFLAVAHEPLAAALQRITPSMDEAARSLGLCSRQLIQRVHLPLLKGGVVTAMILVFVDVMKEMPITLMTRPFGWDTLATRIFEMTSEGEWERAALPAVALLVAGLFPVILLTRQTER